MLSVYPFSSDCLYINSYAPIKKSLELKKAVLNQVDLDKLIKENFSEEEEKPCSKQLYSLANNTKNIWYKFYCELIANSHNYTEFSSSLRREILYDDDISISDHILLALEYANLYDFDMMEKEFRQAMKKLNQCPLIIEYIWEPRNIYLLDQLKKYFPNNSTDKDIIRFYKIIFWTFNLYPNINERAMISSVAIELLLRNSFYGEAKNLKDFLIDQAQSFGLYSVDLYEISNIHRIELIIIKSLVFLLPLSFGFIVLSLKSVNFQYFLVRKAIITILTLALAIIFLQLDIKRNAAVISFLSNSSDDFKSGLIHTKETNKTITLLSNNSYKEESQFLSALYNYINSNNNKAYDLYQSILSRKNIKKALKAKIYNNLGVIHFKLKEYQQAESYFKLALAIDEKFAPSLYNLYLLTSNQDLLEEAIKSRKSKILLLSSYKPTEPYFEILDYKELMRLFSMNKNYLYYMKEFIKDNKSFSFYLKTELMIVFMTSLLLLLYGKMRQRNSFCITQQGLKKEQALKNKIINILIPGRYFFENHRFALGIIFFFGYFLSLIILIELYKNNDLFILKFQSVKAWAEIAKAQDYNTVALLDPILYSLLIYILFLTFMPNLLMVILGINLKSKV